MPIRDSQLLVRMLSDGILAGTDSAEVYPTGGLDIEGSYNNALYVILPTPTGTTPVLQINVLAATTSTCDSTGTLIASRGGINAAGEYVIPFYTRKRSVCFEFDMTSASGQFSAVIASWVTLNHEVDWTRVGEFH